MTSSKQRKQVQDSTADSDPEKGTNTSEHEDEELQKLLVDTPTTSKESDDDTNDDNKKTFSLTLS